MQPMFRCGAVCYLSRTMCCFLLLFLLPLLVFVEAADPWVEMSPTGYDAPARVHHCSVVWDNSMVVFGGLGADGTTYLNDVFKYHLGTNTFTLISASNTPPTGRVRHACSIYHDDRLLVVGGFNGAPLDDIWEFDLIPMALYGHSVHVPWSYQRADASSPRALVVAGHTRLPLPGRGPPAFSGATWMLDLTFNDATSVLLGAGQREYAEGETAASPAPLLSDGIFWMDIAVLRKRFIERYGDVTPGPDNPVVSYPAVAEVAGVGVVALGGYAAGETDPATFTAYYGDAATEYATWQNRATTLPTGGSPDLTGATAAVLVQTTAAVTGLTGGRPGPVGLADLNAPTERLVLFGGRRGAAAAASKTVYVLPLSYPYAAKCSLDLVEAGGVVTAGQLVGLLFYAYDLFGRAYEGPPSDFNGTVACPGPTRFPISFTSYHDGSYLAQFNATRAGACQLAITTTHDGLMVAGLPYPLRVAPAEPDYGGLRQRVTNAPPGAMNSSQTVVIQLLVADPWGNPRLGGGGDGDGDGDGAGEVDLVQLNATGPARVIAGIGDGQGRYNLTYTPRLEGSQSVAILVNGHAVAQYTVQVAHGALVYGATFAGAGVAPRGALAGQNCTFTMSTYDQFGNRFTPQGGGPAPVFVGSLLGPIEMVNYWPIVRGGTARLPYAVPVHCADQGNGSHLCWYNCTQTGQFVLTMAVVRAPPGGGGGGGGGGVGSLYSLMGEQEYPVQIQAGALVASKSLADGDDPTFATVNATYTLRVQTRDRYDNFRPVGGENVTLTGSPIGPSYVNVTDQGNGYYTIRYQFPRNGVTTMNVWVNGTTGPGCTFAVTLGYYKWVQQSQCPDPTYGLPAARSGHSMAYNNGLVWMFGGTNYGDETLLRDSWAFNGVSGSWTKLTTSCSSAAPPARTGHTIALRGDRLYAFGGKTHTGPLNDIWSIDNTNPGASGLTQVASLTAVTPRWWGAFGNRLGLCGSLGIVGDAFTALVGLNVGFGRVYLLQKDAAGPNKWGISAQINPRQEYDCYGRSVSMWGDKYLQIACTLANTLSCCSLGGGVRACAPDASGAFKETVRNVPDSYAYHGLGSTVLLWDDNLFAIASLYDYVRVYRRYGMYTWNVRKDITIYDITDFGTDMVGPMAAWGTDLFVGAHEHTHNKSPTRAGSVYVFRRDLGGRDNWGLVQELFAPDPTVDGHFGAALAAWGDSQGTRVMTAGGGAVYMFTKAASGYYYQLEQKILSPDRTAGLGSGTMLGELAVLCAPSLSWGPYTNAGGCWLFERKSEGGTAAWVPTVSFRSAEPQTDAKFGGTVAISSEAACANMTGKSSAGLSNDLTLLISAVYQTVNGVKNVGKLFVFRYTVAATNRVYVFGGMGTSAAYNDMYSFDMRLYSTFHLPPRLLLQHSPGGQTQTKIASNSQAREGLAAKESLQPPPCYLSIPPLHHPPPPTWMLLPVTHSWTALNPASRPTARYGHTMALDNTTAGAHLWVFGGYDPASAAVRSDLWRYDIAANTWTQIMPTLLPLGGGRVYAASICMGSALYIFGGITSGTSEIHHNLPFSSFSIIPQYIFGGITSGTSEILAETLMLFDTKTMAFHTHRLVGDNPHPRWNTVFVPQAVPASAIDSTSAVSTPATANCPCNGGPETCSCWRGVLFGGEGYWTGTGYPGAALQNGTQFNDLWTLELG
ncbi:hypothetical protein PAPYR_9311 [Paratrimastix pyriformis]|uniref:Uncharacterized protein n=1 Tax=Paratrimastix pyriformis TaxID=342808 RepID=A0ABQ8U8N2_9EUKA|nr:hypothetical protein PAPYR_9311 [Paratrimastix pyriformis]